MSKPLISFVLLTYNQEDFVLDALEGAMSQTYSPMEIIISDDCSSDKTYSIVEDAVKKYQGNHKIKLNRNNKNLGIKTNYNISIAETEGDIIVVAAGDDRSLPNRVQRSYELFKRYPDAMCVNFESIHCDSSLNPTKQIVSDPSDLEVTSLSLRDYIETKDFVVWSGDSRALRREVFTKFPPMKYGKDEDSSTFIRSLLLGNVCYSHEKMVLRRWHNNNVSNFVNIKRFNSYDFLAQPIEDIQYAADKGYISDYLAKLLNYKMRLSARYLLDQTYEANSKWFHILYTKPVDLLRRLKNKLFK